MKKEFSAGGVIFKKIADKTCVLLVEYREYDGRVTFGFPKGRIESGETVEQAAVREIGEEVGLTDIVLKEKLGAIEREALNVDTGERVWKTITLFAVEVRDFVHAKKTHETYQWLPVDEALGRFHYKEDAEFLQKIILHG